MNPRPRLSVQSRRLFLPTFLLLLGIGIIGCGEGDSDPSTRTDSRQVQPAAAAQSAGDDEVMEFSLAPEAEITDEARHDLADSEQDNPRFAESAEGAAAAPAMALEDKAREQVAELEAPIAARAESANRASQDSAEQDATLMYLRSAPGANTAGRFGAEFGGGGSSIGSGREAATRRTVPAAGEELWVIARPATESSRSTAVTPESNLLAIDDQGIAQPFPTVSTEVSAEIHGCLAEVRVRQSFSNPMEQAVDATYAFPLPADAAVSEFLMIIGERRIRGVIREREEAELIYDQARRSGHAASMLLQDRPNLFRQKIANLAPGHRIDAELSYQYPLRYEQDRWEFVFPMGIMPRYNPSETPDPVETAASDDPTLPRPRVSLSIDVHAGLPIRQLQSLHHAIDQVQHSDGHRTITLAAGDLPANRDFVLQYQVAGPNAQTQLMVQAETAKSAGYFSMLVYPPSDSDRIHRQPMEFIYLVDCSGSMRGAPIQQARAAVTHSLRMLTPEDAFQIIQFSSRTSGLGDNLLSATEENINRGLRYLDSLSGSGGTEMSEGIISALRFPGRKERQRVVVFLTDGAIGNENQILEIVARNLRGSRIFSFGVGQSPNRYLMDRLSTLGDGAVSYLSLDQDAVEVMNRFQEIISRPALTHVTVNFPTMEVFDVYPSRIPDLFFGRPILVTGRFRGQPGAFTVSGRENGKEVRYVGHSGTPVTPTTAEPQHSSVARLWARRRICDLLQACSLAPQEQESLQAEILQTALDYNLMSGQTAFVAVDALTRISTDDKQQLELPGAVVEGTNLPDQSEGDL